MPGYDGIEMEGELPDGAGDISGQQPAAGQQDDPGSQQQQQPPTGGQSADAGASGGQQPVWNGQEWTLKYRGQPYIPKSRDELTNLAQKGFSYEQEMGRFKNERQQLQTQFDQLKKQYGHYDEFDNFLKTNPSVQEKIAALIEEHQNSAGAQQPQNGFQFQVYNKMRSEIDELKKLNTDRLNAEDDRRLAESLQKLRAAHPDHDWEFDDGTGTLEKKLLQFAFEGGITNVEHAYWAFMGPQNGTNAKADALKKAAAAKQAATRSGIVQQGAGGAGGQQQRGYRPGMSYGDIAREMANELKT